ncbi:MAG: DNA translocase FtsK [Alphaproteobacteria bacterium]|nr:DNA translocase FtsK [Alphaproteobacteria bacterium]
MAKESKFLPQRISDALKSLLARVFGAVVCVLGIWATFALLFYNPYLDGFGVASSFGDQSLMGHVVGMVRYAVGVIPGLFVFLCVARCGAATVIGLDSGDAPEYNFLRGFIAVCMGAAGFGLLVPSASFGGMFGAIVASDVSSLIGSWAVIPGIFCVLGFLVMGGMLLHVKWAHVRGALRMFVRWLRWIASAFHLVRIEQNDNEEPVAEETDEEYDEEEAEEEEEEEKPKRGLLGKKVAKPVKATTSVAAVKIRNAGAYELPDPKFLERSNFSKCSVTNDLKQNAKNMEVHFAQYGVYGKVVGIKPGPVVTLYEFMPDDGTRMTDVNKTVTDMVRAMATENIRIAHIPRTQLIGVEMVNLNRQTVRYRGLVENPLFTESKYKIPLALGVDIGGNPMYFDLAKMPHMLIAGRTGSGKSVFVQSLITSIVYHFTPDKCKLMIIDPKGVDFGFWDDIPHLITPIVKLDPGAAVNALKWAVREMEERYKQLQLLNARNIESYNEMAAEKRASGEKLTKQVAVGTDEETGELLFETQEVDLSDMSYIVIIIDEVADLMSLARKEVESCVQRIAQKARAAGIHLIMATQRPDATTITGVIKANFPTRVSFQARSRIDSTTCLGEGGAENLLAMGDMLFSEAGRIPVRIHGAFIDDSELTRIGNFLRAQGEPEYASGVTDGEENTDAAPAPSASEVRVEKNADMYEQAKEIVVRDKKPTISYIQRRLGIGYNKAAGFIERMEQEGVVSAPDANNKRHIL